MKRIIIYATKYGSTEEVARRLKAQLGEETQLCNILTDRVPALAAYGTVILGGSIYIGRVQKQIAQYASGHAEELAAKNVGLFLCAGEQKPDVQLALLQTAFSKALMEHAAAKAVLGYAFLFEKMKFFDKLIIKKMKGDSISLTAYSDEHIASFANALKRAEEKI